MTTSEYDNIVQALTNYKVSLTDDNGNLRSTYDIMKDIADVAKELENTDPNAFAALAETLSGTRQQNVFSSIVDNFSEAEKAMGLMNGRTGELRKSYEEFSNSTTARINAFKAAFTELSADVVDSDLIKFFVDGGTQIVNAIDFIIGGMNKLGGATTILESVFISLFIAKLPSMIHNIGSFAESIQLVFMGVSDAVKAWRSSKSTDNPISFIESMTNEFPNFKIAAASTAVTAIVAVINLIKRYRENLAKEAEETAAKARESAEKIASSVDEYVLGLSDLREKYDSGTISSNELTGALVEQLEVMGWAPEKIQGLIDGYSNLGDAISAVTEEVTQYNLAESAAALDAERRSLLRNFGSPSSKIYRANASAAGASQARHDRGLYEYNQGIISESMFDQVRSLYVPAENAARSKDYNVLLDYYYKLLDVQEKLKGEAVLNPAIYDSSLYTGITKEINGMSEEMEQYAGVLKMAAEAQVYLNKTEIGSQIDGSTVKERMGQLRSAITEVIGDVGSIGSVPSQIIDEIIDDVFPNLVSGANEASNAINGVGKSTEASIKTIDDTQKAYDSITKAVKEYAEWSGLSSKTIEDLDAVIPGLTKKLFDAEGGFSSLGKIALSSEESLINFARGLGEGIDFDQMLKSVRASVTPEISSILKDVASEYSILSDVQKEMAESGKLSVSTIQKLTDAGLSEYMHKEAGAIKVDTDAWLENTKAKIEARIEDLKTKNSGLKKENEMLDGTMIQGATDKIRENSKAIDDNEKEIITLESALSEFSDTAEDATASMTDFVRAVNGLDNISKGLGQLDKIYADIINGKEFDFTSLIDSGFTTTFGGLGEAYENFISTIVNSSGDITACKNAFGELTTEYIKQSGILDEVTEKNRDLTVAVLKQNGVANAAAIVDNALAINKGKLAVASAEAADMEWKEVGALSDETETGSVAKTMLAQLALEKAKVNYTTINTSADIDNLIALANTAGASVTALQNLARAKDLMGDYESTRDKANAESAKSPNSIYAKVLSYSANLKKSQAQKILGDITYDFTPIDPNDFKSQYGGGSASTAASAGGGGGSSGGGSSGGGSSETWFDQELKLHQHYLAMDQETTSDYLSWLDSAYKKAYDENAITIDDYYKYQEEVYSKSKELFKDVIGDMQHQIDLLGRQDDKTDEIVSVYKKMQDAVHEQAEKYRAMGVDENSDLIEDLQNQWWNYYDAIENAMKGAFDKYLNESKFAIDVLKSNDADQSEIVGSWKNILSEINKEIDKFTRMGYDTSSDFMQSLVKEAQSTKQEIVSAIEEAVSEANALVDGLENVYKTVTDAAKEYASAGYLSVDSLQSILELGPQYLQFLYNENGQLVLNEENLQRVIAAKTEQMAAETALSYAKQVLLATENNEIHTLEALTNVEYANSSATWDMAYATVGLARAIGEANGISSSYYDTAVANITKIQSITKTAINSISAYYKTLDPDYISQSDALNKILDMTEDMIKWENDQAVDALEKQKDAYADIIDQKKEQIKLNQKISDQNNTIAEKIERMAKLEAQIKQLSLDDTREAAAERKTLEAELAELQKDLADTQAEYAVDAQTDALDAQLKSYQDEKDNEIEALKNSLNSTEKLYQAAITRIDSGWDSLYSDLSSWNSEYGSELSSTLDSAWQSALEAAQRYGSFVDALEGVKSYTGLGEFDTEAAAAGTATYGSANTIASQMRSNSLSWWTASTAEQTRLSNANVALAEQYRSVSGDNIYSQNGAWYHADSSRLYALSNDEIIRAIVTKMKANSAAWTYADDTTRNALSQQNIDLGNRIAGLTSDKVYRDKDGVWWIGNKKLYESYHRGGVVGDPTLKQNEVMAVLEKGEAVLDKKKEGALYQIVDFASKLSEKIGSVIDASALNSLFGSRRNADILSSLSGVDKRINSLGSDIGGCHIDKIEVTAPIQVVQKLDEHDIKRHSTMIGELSAEYIKEGFRRRGLTPAPSIV